MKFLFLILTGLLVIGTSQAAEKLDSKIVYQLDKVTSALNDAEEYYDSSKQKRAKKSLSSAQKEMKKIFSWYKGKFDPNHPDIVAPQKRISAIADKINGTKQVPVVIAKPATPASNLSAALNSKVTRKMETVSSHLDSAEKYISVNSQKQAKRSVDSAKKELNNIFSWYEGKFDPNHPEIVALQKRVATVSSNVGNGESVVSNNTETTASKKETSNKLSRNALYFIKKIDNASTNIQSQLENKQYENAERSLIKARKDYDILLTKNKNEISTSHSEAIRIAKLLDKLESELTTQKADKKKLGEVLNHVFSVIDQTLPILDKAVTETRYAIYKLRDLNNNEISANEISQHISDFRERLDRVASLVPDARELVNTFNLRLSEKEKLLRLFPKTYPPASGSVSKINGLINILEKELDNQLATIVGTAEERINSANTDLAAGALNINNKGGIEQYVIGISDPLLDVIKLTYQTKAENPNGFPSSTSQRMLLRTKALKYQEEIATIAQKVLQGEAAARLQAQNKLAAARFPEESIPVSSSDKAMIVEAFEQEFGSDSLLKFAVYSNWEKRVEAKWINDLWVVNTFNYLGIWAAKKTISGKYRVYRINLRRLLQQDGNWGPLKHRSVGHSYEILKENI